jgi:hypothetical protein
MQGAISSLLFVPLLAVASVADKQKALHLPMAGDIECISG